MITTIIFDCGEVLVRGMYGADEPIALLVGRSKQHVWKRLNSWPKNQMFCGWMTERRYWEVLIEENGWSCTPQQLETMIRQNFTEVPGTRPIIEKLRQTGYKMGMLWVHAREWIEYCQAKHQYHHLLKLLQLKHHL